MTDTIQIETRIEGKRGCGYRKPGGLYVVAGKPNAPCGRLPTPLTVCPCCNGGIKPSRGWTWMDPRQLFAGKLCAFVEASPNSNLLMLHTTCPLANENLPDRAGLLWIGEAFYPTPKAYMDEAIEMGLSRRISAVPKDFVVGEHWVMLAHRKGIKTGVKFVCSWDGQETGDEYDTEGEAREKCQGESGDWTYEPVDQFQAAIFTMFKPTAVEYVVKGDETDEDLERLVKRGLTLVKVVNPGRPSEGLGSLADNDDSDIDAQE